MGVVYEAAHPDLPGQRLALKLIQAGSGAAAEQALVRFGREAQALARVVHPGVLRVHTLGRAPEGPYLVTDLVEGEALDTLCRRGPLGPRRAAEIARDLARAVEAVHARGVLHRDLKPANVIVRPDGSPVLLDFGLARDLDAERLTRTGEVLGTPAYMSPEQAGGERPDALDARTDVYGLGAVLFTLLSGGRPPFEGPAHQAIAAVLLREPRWPDCDPALLAVLRRAMSKQPGERQASAAALAAELEGWLAGARGPRRPRRAPAIALSTATTAAVIAAGAMVLGGGARDGAEQTTSRAGGTAEAAPIPSTDAPTRQVTSAPEAGPELMPRRLLPAGRFEHPGEMGAAPEISQRRGALFLSARRLVSWNTDGALRLWEVDADGVVQQQGPSYELGFPVFAVAIAPDGRSLLAGGKAKVSESNLALVDLVRGSIERRAVLHDVLALAFDPRVPGRYAVGTGIAEGDNLFVQHIGGGPPELSAAYGGAVHAICWVGQWLVVGGGSAYGDGTEKRLKVWRPADWSEPPATLSPRQFAVNSIALTPDEQTLIVADNGGALQGVPVGALRADPAPLPFQQPVRSADGPAVVLAHQGSVQRAIVSRRGGVVYSVLGDSDRREGELAAWRVDTRERLTRESWPAPLQSVDVCPEGRLLVTLDIHGKGRLWRVR